MATQNVETVTSSGDKAKVALAIMALLAGVAGFYVLAKEPMIVRVASVIGGIAAGILIGWMSEPGRRFLSFAREAYVETRKVVWPTRKETIQTTIAVFGFVLILAIYLWMVDKTLEWILYDVILGWKH